VYPRELKTCSETKADNINSIKIETVLIFCALRERGDIKKLKMVKELNRIKINLFEKLMEDKL
jgi:hypothetical protein